MVTSMTGFGRGKVSEQDFEITVEIKSVNHRYFEYSSRMPRAYQFIDEKIKSLLSSRISRGKALHNLAKEYRLKDDLKVSALVGNSDIFTVKRREVDDEVISELVLKATAVALDNFIAMRTVEGERLMADVKSRSEQILEWVSVIEERSPATVREHREKIEQKIRELIGDVQIDEQRLLTETAIFADKIAVAEETVRLRSHIATLNSMFENGGAIGRKLDFIVQEMNRETNTIGSKAQDIEINRIVVDIKSEIEKIREQIQNIE